MSEEKEDNLLTTRGIQDERLELAGYRREQREIIFYVLIKFKLSVNQIYHFV